jgi:hypothetical protein
MKRIGLLLILVFQHGFGQNEQNNKIKFTGNFGIELKTNNYFGDNYLAKGHENPALGFEISLNFIEFKKFKLGVSFEKTTLEVNDYAIGGFIDKTNITVYNVNLSYLIPINNKIAVQPTIFYGQLFIKQKNGGKNYGVQNGNDLGLGACFNYNLNKSIQVFSKAALSQYFLTANTAQEFENYFNSSNCLSLSLGCKLLY